MKAAGINAAQAGGGSWGSAAYGCYDVGCGSPWLTGWQAAWNGSNFESLAYRDLLWNTYSANHWFQFYGVDVNALAAFGSSNGSMTDLYGTLFRRQSFSKGISDVQGRHYFIGFETGDESDSVIGQLWQPQGQMGSTTLGIPGHTLGGTAGFSQVVIGSGCPGSCPATFSWKSFGVKDDATTFFTYSGNCLITGSGVAGADGSCSGFTTTTGNLAFNDRLGVYFTQMTTTLTNGNAGTYTSANTPNFTIQQPYAYSNGGVPVTQDYLDRLYGCAGGNNWMTGNRPVMAVNINGGSTGSGVIRTSAYGYACSDYVVMNISPGSFNRLGPRPLNVWAYDYDQGYRPFADGYVPSNAWFSKPIVLQTFYIADTCDKNASHTNGGTTCRFDYFNSGDKWVQSGPTPSTIFVTGMGPIMVGAIGQKPYGMYASPVGLRFPAAGLNPSQQDWCDFTDHCPANFSAHAFSGSFAQHEDELLLSPMTNCPDSFRYGYPQLRAVCHKSASGKVMMVLMNYGLTDRVNLPVDVSTLQQGGPARIWTLSAWGDTLASASPSATSFTIPLLRSYQAWVYITQPIGTTDDMTYYAPQVALVSGATDVVLDISYYVDAHEYFDSMHIFCPAGACPSTPVNQHNLDVYYRYRHLDANKNVVRSGSWQSWIGQ